jgi:hypothetical protein
MTVDDETLRQRESLPVFRQEANFLVHELVDSMGSAFLPKEECTWSILALPFTQQMTVNGTTQLASVQNGSWIGVVLVQRPHVDCWEE